jgi:hypothetical protein
MYSLVDGAHFKIREALWQLRRSTPDGREGFQNIVLRQSSNVGAFF